MGADTSEAVFLEPLYSLSHYTTCNRTNVRLSQSQRPNIFLSLSQQCKLRLPVLDPIYILPVDHIQLQSFHQTAELTQSQLRQWFYIEHNVLV